MVKIIAIQLDPQINESIKIDGNSKYLFPISRFNIFIGENNSGKSRLLRNIFSTEPNSRKFLTTKTLDHSVQYLSNYISSQLIPNTKTHLNEADAEVLIKPVKDINDCISKYKLILK